MASDQFRHNSSALAQKIRDRWIELSIEDIAFIDVYRDRLVERLITRYLKTCEQAAKQVSKWEDNLVLSSNCTKLQPSDESSTIALNSPTMGAADT